MTELSLREQLLVDYDAHEDAIERAALLETWALGDWIAKYVPPSVGGAGMHADKVQPEPHLTVADLAGRRGRSRQWLSDLRKVAEATATDRLPRVAPRVYIEALRQSDWDLGKANARLIAKGVRLRDQAGPMESPKALVDQLAKRSPEERASVARDLIADPTVAELLSDVELTPIDFGAEWADTLVLRVHTNVEQLTGLIAREGLRFAPSTPLREMLDWLTDAERQLGEVRAAVQERMIDERVPDAS